MILVLVPLSSIYAGTIKLGIDSVLLDSEYQKSKILIEKNQIDSAIFLLSDISTISLENKYWELYTNSKIDLARLYEVKEELKKCILLCANCHREVHSQSAASTGNRS